MGTFFFVDMDVFLVLAGAVITTGFVVFP